MFTFLKSNWRETLAIAIVTPLLLLGLFALGTPEVADSGPLSSAVSLAVTLIGASVKFAWVLFMAWAGLHTLPEASKFTFGHQFDIFWQHTPSSLKGLICLIAAGVLAIVAALCMASS